MTDIVDICDREILELKQRLARARSIKRIAMRERRRRLALEKKQQRDQRIRAMYAWCMADPDRTLADTAAHFGVNRIALHSAFFRRGLLLIGPHNQAKARRRAA